MRVRGARSRRLLGVARHVTRGCAAALALAAATAACGSEDLEGRTLLDVGRFCVASLSDKRVTFSLRIGPPEFCLSGCGWSAKSRCTATLTTERRIDLTSRLETRQRPSSGIMECTGECLGIVATCELEVPAEGRYQFGFASGVDSAMLPLEGAIPLFDDHGCDPDISLLPNELPPPPPRTERVPEFEGRLE